MKVGPLRVDRVRHSTRKLIGPLALRDPGARAVHTLAPTQSGPGVRPTALPLRWARLLDRRRRGFFGTAPGQIPLTEGSQGCLKPVHSVMRAQAGLSLAMKGVLQPGHGIKELHDVWILPRDDVCRITVRGEIHTDDHTLLHRFDPTCGGLACSSSSPLRCGIGSPGEINASNRPSRRFGIGASGEMSAPSTVCVSLGASTAR